MNNARGTGRTFVMGDVHGAYRALRQCLDRSDFDYVDDRLIFLGDVCDGWPDTYQCIEELLKIRQLIFIFGNHDFWALEWMQTGVAEAIWRDQGGKATMKSYEKKSIPEAHVRLLAESVSYHVQGNRLFVHAGIQMRTPLNEQGLSTFLWDRTLARLAMDFHSKGMTERLTDFDEVYLGHTPVASDHPLKCCEVWLMDTGAGWSGCLSMMDVETKEFFTSDSVPSLYPGVTGRKTK